MYIFLTYRYYVQPAVLCQVTVLFQNKQKNCYSSQSPAAQLKKMENHILASTRLTDEAISELEVHLVSYFQIQNTKIKKLTQDG